LEIAPTNEMLKIALKSKPSFVCIVPEKREELTTEGGLNLDKDNFRIKKIIYYLKKKGIRSSLFIEPRIQDIRKAKKLGADCVELHTGKFCNLYNLNKKFDVILNMEIVEHVSDLNHFIKSCANLLKKNGIIFIATINRTLKSYLFAIAGAEYILKWLPIGTHDWNLFVKPEELIKTSMKHNLKSNGIHGMIYNPLLDQWKTSKDNSVNYISSFIKK